MYLELNYWAWTLQRFIYYFYVRYIFFYSLDFLLVLFAANFVRLFCSPAGSVHVFFLCMCIMLASLLVDTADVTCTALDIGDPWLLSHINCKLLDLNFIYNHKLTCAALWTACARTLVHHIPQTWTWTYRIFSERPIYIAFRFYMNVSVHKIRIR